jgi:carnitine 3-dehydrogenase
MNVDDIKRVCCLGAGTIGASWATNFVMKGVPVNLYNFRDLELNDAKIGIRQNLQTLVDNDVFPADKIDETMALITYTTDIKEALKNVQLAQEAVPETYEMKQKFVALFEEHAPPEAIFATSTSGLLLSKIAEHAKNKERILGAHPWNPPHLMPLVECLALKGCPPENLDALYNFFKKIGKEPIRLLKEAYGHIGNRIQSAVYRETVNIVLSGLASVEDVDKAFVYGPGLRYAIMGQALIFHLGGGKEGTREFMRKIAPSMSIWIADLAKWSDFPEDWSEMGHIGTEEEIKNRPEEIGNTVETIKAYRDKMILDLLKLHKKL